MLTVQEMDALFTVDGLVALVTLTFLEIILGIDNVIFISILSSKLRQVDQARFPKGYIYFAMGFSVFVEMINLRVRHGGARPVKLPQTYVPDRK